MIHLILIIAIVGFLVWLVLQIPMPPIFKTAIIGIVSIAVVLYVLQALGIDTGFHALRLR